MKQKIDKLVATVVSCLILVLPGALSARERRGAKLVVSLKDGQTVAGELIAVKPDSLLLFSPSGKDESVDIPKIREIKLVKKSRALKGALSGFVAGAVAGSLLYLVMVDKEDRSDTFPFFMWPPAFAVPAGLVGLGAGALAGSDQTTEFEGMSESALKDFLATLSRKARIRDFR